MTTPISRRRLLSAGAVGAAVGVVAGSQLTRVVSSTATADADGVDIGFCADMSTHHLQAMAMCQRVLGRDTGDPVQAAASEVLQTQGIEVGMMWAWLADWGQPTTPATTGDLVMAWMHGGTGMPLEMMPGYASDEQLRELSLANGIEQGRVWLELMRAHHVGGVAMASAAVETAEFEKVRRLAQTQVDVQSYEIQQYDLLLADTYA